ncbi:MAG TPA: DNA ligase D [Microvirga sp.]|jgi:bifunctional non-homologous end joining protein LigD|nr:DNA ligase D [Microvirga sp.]
MAKLATSRAKRARTSAATRATGEPAAVEIAGVPVTHPERVLWEEQGVTKRELAEYYVAVADRILPHVVGRPLTLVRCPAGAKKTCFFQKHAWAGLSGFIHRQSLGESEADVLSVRDIRGVVAFAQAGVLEIHPWGARLSDLDRPDRVVFDFDPGEGVAWSAVVAAAREMRERLDALKLQNFVKTTGGKGLHVVVPLTPEAGWDQAKRFSKALSDAMVADAPERYTTTSVKSEREGKIFIDYLRNTRGATAVAPYSTRARPGAPVSVPLAWDELSDDAAQTRFTVETLPRRLAAGPDPWAGFFAVEQTLPAAPTRRRRPKKPG